MSEQQIIEVSGAYEELDCYLRDGGFKHILLVCDRSFPCLQISKYFTNLEKRMGIKVVKFDHIEPNPVYESAVEGVDLFCREKCDTIIAVGGGSPIDVAKCIKLYSNMKPSENYLEQKIVPNDIKLLAIPTTAGTGSEATKYAVLYYKGEKQSISDDSCIPSTVLFDASALKTLPEYQKKSTMMDALCHAIESFWSVNSTLESHRYSKSAIESILLHKDAYLKGVESGNRGMLKAANLAGKAINITQTTAGHAMCYKLTSLYGIAHGHAAALCLSKLFPYMYENKNQCIDSRGEEYLDSVFREIAEAMGCTDVISAIIRFDELIDELGLTVPKPTETDYQILKTSVNPIRLKNNPIQLDVKSIDMLYHKILAGK